MKPVETTYFRISMCYAIAAETTIAKALNPCLHVIPDMEHSTADTLDKMISMVSCGMTFESQ